VKLTEVCPARTLTYLGLAPAAIHRATAVCRRSWGRSGTNPAARTAGSQTAKQGPDAIIQQVRAAESSDPEGRRWPRGKRHDDASAVYLDLNEGTTC
jgi:hypothetical protein